MTFARYRASLDGAAEWPLSVKQLLARLRLPISAWHVGLPSVEREEVQFHRPAGKLGVALPGRRGPIAERAAAALTLAEGTVRYRDLGGQNDDVAMLANIAAAVKARA